MTGVFAKHIELIYCFITSHQLLVSNRLVNSDNYSMCVVWVSSPAFLNQYKLFIAFSKGSNNRDQLFFPPHFCVIPSALPKRGSIKII